MVLSIEHVQAHSISMIVKHSMVPHTSPCHQRPNLQTSIATSCVEQVSWIFLGLQSFKPQPVVHIKIAKTTKMDARSPNTIGVFVSSQMAKKLCFCNVVLNGPKGWEGYGSLNT